MILYQRGRVFTSERTKSSLTDTHNATRLPMTSPVNTFDHETHDGRSQSHEIPFLDDEIENDGIFFHRTGRLTYSLFPGGSPVAKLAPWRLEFWKVHSFLIGSIFAVVATIIDLNYAWGEFNGKVFDDDDDVEGPLQYWDAYKVLMVISTSLYLFESVLHVYAEQHETESEASSIEEGGNSASLGVNHNHHRKKLWFAYTFGVGAVFDLTSSFLDSDSFPWPSYIAECASALLFWMSSNIFLYTKRMVYYQSRSCSALFVGDVIFWLGCTTDVVASVIDYPRLEITYLYLAIAGMVSALFWCADATIYEIAGVDMFDMELLIPGDGDSLLSVPLGSIAASPSLECPIERLEVENVV